MIFQMFYKQNAELSKKPKHLCQQDGWILVFYQTKA
jgi:hypothetical protein